MYRDLELGDLETRGLGRALRRTFTDFGLERGAGGRVEEERRRQRGGSDEWRRRRDARVACGRDRWADGSAGGMAGLKVRRAGWAFHKEARRPWADVTVFWGWEWAGEGGSRMTLADLGGFLGGRGRMWANGGGGGERAGEGRKDGSRVAFWAKDDLFGRKRDGSGWVFVRAGREWACGGGFFEEWENDGYFFLLGTETGVRFSFFNSFFFILLGGRAWGERGGAQRLAWREEPTY